LLPALVLCLVASAAAGSPEKLRAIVGEETGALNEASASQERIDRLDDDTQKLLAEYRQVTAEAESFKTYNDQLAAQIPSQLDEMASIEQQLQDVETTQREVLPMMQRMLETLERFVQLDVPFLADERRRRIANLKEMMDRADVTVSEKYRRIVEAYQIEMEYGRTLEAYEGKLGDAEDARAVQFVRVGRIALLYQTLDRKETGYWDGGKKDWVVDDSYRHAFTENLEIAKKIGAPDLLTVPVPAPKEVEQ
jgi:septal ring factor EnvC (AmiA/AmiB activator)